MHIGALYKNLSWAFPVAQWLRLYTPNAGAQGTQIPPEFTLSGPIVIPLEFATTEGSRAAK